MRHAIRAAALAFLALAASGCWDQQLLKDERNISIGGIDTASKGLIRATVSIRDILVSESGSKDTSEVHSVVARSTDHARELLDDEVSGQYSSAKMRVLVLGEEMVRSRDIMPYLDVYYRDPRSPLNARVAIAQGKAEDIIRLKMVGPKTIGLHIDNLLKSMELQSQVPSVTIQTLHPLDRGFDFSLPYLKLTDGMPKVEGIALFNGVHMTGKLNLDRSKIYLLLAGEKNKNLRITLKIQNDDKDEGYDYTTIDVLKARRKLKIHVDKEGRPRVALNVRLRVSVIEDPSNHLYKKEVLHKLEKTLSERLTNEADSVVATMQEARHDGFGIARRIMSFYPNLWRKLDWKEVYPSIPFDVGVTLDVINTGIIR